MFFENFFFSMWWNAIVKFRGELRIPIYYTVIAERCTFGRACVRYQPVVADEAKLAIVFTYFFIL